MHALEGAMAQQRATHARELRSTRDARATAAGDDGGDAAAAAWFRSVVAPQLPQLLSVARGAKAMLAEVRAAAVDAAAQSAADSEEVSELLTNAVFDVERCSLAALRSRVTEEQLKRRQLQSTVAQLRGRVRAFAVVQPLAEPRDAHADAPVVEVLDARSLEVTTVETGERRRFVVDRVFGDEDEGSRRSHFSLASTMADLVGSVAAGGNVCLLSHGPSYAQKSAYEVR